LGQTGIHPDQVHLGFEETSGGHADRHYVTEQREYALTNQRLWVRVISRASEYFGDEGASGGASSKKAILGMCWNLLVQVCRGVEPTTASALDGG